MNNNGFAITTTVYSILILTVLILFGMLLTMNEYRDMDREFVNEVELNLNEQELNKQ